MNIPYNSASNWAKQHFGKRIQKVPINGGFSCPNRDGKLSKKGCIYCNNNAFTPFYTDSKKSISEQLKTGINFFSKRYNCNEFFAYFQTYSGTYGTIKELEKKYREAMSIPEIKGLIIATRPDCINEYVVNLLLELKKETYIRVEIGVESFEDRVLNAINRCHDSQTAIDSISMLSKAQIDTSVHLIFGLPNESNEDAKNYALILSNSAVNFVKLHHLQIVKESELSKIITNNKEFVKLHSLDSYIEKIAEFLSYLRKDIYIERFINRIPQNMLIAPKFGNINENKFSELLCKYMIDKGISQGYLLKYQNN